jgi:hypothetical protein
MGIKNDFCLVNSGLTLDFQEHLFYYGHVQERTS